MTLNNLLNYEELKKEKEIFENEKSFIFKYLDEVKYNFIDYFNNHMLHNFKYNFYSQTQRSSLIIEDHTLNNFSSKIDPLEIKILIHNYISHETDYNSQINKNSILITFTTKKTNYESNSLYNKKEYLRLQNMFKNEFLNIPEILPKEKIDKKFLEQKNKINKKNERLKNIYVSFLKSFLSYKIKETIYLGKDFIYIPMEDLTKRVESKNYSLNFIMKQISEILENETIYYYEIDSKYIKIDWSEEKLRNKTFFIRVLNKLKKSFL